MILDVTDNKTGEHLLGKVRRWDILYGRVICEPIKEGNPDATVNTKALVHIAHRDGYTDEFKVDVEPPI
jgi:hypothetical protein